MHRFAARADVPLTMPAAHPRRSVEAMRLLIACPDAQRPALTHALYRAYWVDGRDVADRAVLAELAARHGLDAGVIDAPETKAALHAATEAAAARGLFGVPAMGVGDRFFWGQDRLHFVEAALTGRPPAYAEPRPAVAGARVTFFHDFSSPFSYLASTQVDARLVATGAAVVSRPILVGALFREIGTPDVPMLAMSEARRRYVARDLADWAAFWNAPFRFPDTFPLRTVAALRVAIAEPAATPALYRAAWVDNQDVGRPEVLGTVLDAAGFDGKALVARAAEDDELKAALRENTRAAEAAGACGVPTFLVERPDRAPEVFWGQDRFELVQEALCR
jgi:2-hydroxychromene-2-carboxylate isomerase